jgi:chromate transporter
MGTLLKIISVFFKIGILTVGGGLAMIPVIQQEMERLGWLNSQQFLDILGVAQITPGAISVNTATFSGYTVMADAYPGQLWMACLGALAGTISVCMPSFFCVNIASQVWSRYREHDCMLSIFNNKITTSNCF